MFTQEQLELIKTAAKKTKNQGEIAVYNYIDSHASEGFTSEKLNIIKYCAEECKRQRSGEMSVYDMVCAWSWMQENAQVYNPPMLDLVMIEQLGVLVEPIDNRGGFRKIPIGVTDPEKGWIEKAPWERVPSLLQLLIDSYYEATLDLDPDGGRLGFNILSKTPEDQFYYEYENIHPFRDGNGRTGKILYNYLCGTLENPILPPNFWGGSNP